MRWFKILLFVAIVGTPCVAQSAVITTTISFDPTLDSSGPQNVYISRVLAQPINLFLNDTLRVTFSGLPNTLLTDVNDVMNAFITWTPYRPAFPVFQASFHVVDYSGSLISETFLPSDSFRPADYSGGCPYSSQEACRTNTFYKTLGIVPVGDSASIRSVDVDFTLVSGVQPEDGVLVSKLSFESFSLSSSVPEPSTWAMMIIGFAGVGFMAYRRRNRGSTISA